MSNLSDFRIPAGIIKELCKKAALPFVDIPIAFKEPTNQCVNGILHVGKTEKIGQTLYNIIQSYILNSQTIIGKELIVKENIHDYLIYIATLLRRIAISDVGWNESKPDENYLQRLNQRPLVWSLIKNLILPLYDKPVKNILVMCGISPYMDISRFFKEGEVNHKNAPKEDFIFLNDSIENSAVKNAMLFLSALEYFELSPLQVISDLFEGNLYEKMLGILKLGLIDNSHVEEFIAVIFSVLGISVNLFTHVRSDKSRVVVAQMGDTMPQTVPMQWWYQGLPEKMLGPARGFNWQTYKSLEPMVKEFWDQVELIKSRKAQGEGVNFNDLLRLKQLQTSEPPMRADQTIQSLLSSQRIW